MKRLCAVAAPVLLIALAGCGSSSKSSSSSSSSSAGSTSTPPQTSQPPAPSAGGSVAVTMQNIAFNPKAVTAKVGQTVKWTNMDTAPHNVTYVSGPKFASSSTFSNGGKFSLKLTKPGTINYVCTIHPGMTATITVTP